MWASLEAQARGATAATLTASGDADCCPFGDDVPSTLQPVGGIPSGPAALKVGPCYFERSQSHDLIVRPNLVLPEKSRLTILSDSRKEHFHDLRVTDPESPETVSSGVSPCW